MVQGWGDKGFCKNWVTAGETTCVILPDWYALASMIRRHFLAAVLFNPGHGSSGRVNMDAECQFLFVLSIGEIITRYHTNSSTKNQVESAGGRGGVV